MITQAQSEFLSVQSINPECLRRRAGQRETAWQGGRKPRGHRLPVVCAGDEARYRAQEVFMELDRSEGAQKTEQAASSRLARKD